MAWLRLLPYAGVAFIIAILTWQVAGMFSDAAIDRINDKHARAMDAAITAERAACAKAQATTKEVSDALQKKLQTVNARHADAVHRLLKHEAAKRVRPANAPGGHDAAAPGDGVRGTGAGVDGVARLDRAAAAERQTEQLIACQDYVSRVTR